jgi:hypothetical protein
LGIRGGWKPWNRKKKGLKRETLATGSSKSLHGVWVWEEKEILHKKYSKQEWNPV